MKLRFLFLVILTAILLEGCAAGWHKQGVSEYETENSLAQCEYEAAGGNNQNERGDFVNNCMKRQGFRWYYPQKKIACYRRHFFIPYACLNDKNRAQRVSLKPHKRESRKLVMARSLVRRRGHLLARRLLLSILSIAMTRTTRQV